MDWFAEQELNLTPIPSDQGTARLNAWAATYPHLTRQEQADLLGAKVRAYYRWLRGVTAVPAMALRLVETLPPAQAPVLVHTVR